MRQIQVVSLVVAATAERGMRATQPQHYRKADLERLLTTAGGAMAILEGLLTTAGGAIAILEGLLTTAR